MGFVRAWTINSSLVLLTHQHIDDRINGASSYLGAIKQVREEPDLVPRAWWWPQNNGLIGPRLSLQPQPPTNGSIALSKIDDFVSQVGVVVEAEGGSGVLVETVPTGGEGSAAPSLTALTYNSSDGCFSVGVVASPQPLTLRSPERLCRGLPLHATADRPLHFRVLLRNHKSRAAVSSRDRLLSPGRARAR